MTTQLFLVDGGGGVSGYSMVRTLRGLQAGGALFNGVVNTTASGTEIQWTQTAGGASLSFVTKPFAAAVTISGAPTVNIWAFESAAAANCGLRLKLFKLTSGGTKTLFATLDEGAELSTGIAAIACTGSVTSTAFVKGDRLVVEPYIYNVGTMGGSATCEMRYGRNTSGAQGDSYITMAEDIRFVRPVLIT